MDQAIAEVKNCIVTYNIRSIVPTIRTALDAGAPAEAILNDGMVAGMGDIGEGFKNNTIFMPQMLMAAKTMQCGLEVIKPLLADSDAEGGGKAVVGSVMGDVHDIGMNLVAVMLQGAGMDVVDLGADVPPDAFTKALDDDPEITIVACSSSMTPTRAALKDTVDAINARGNRSDIAVFVGGATMDQMFCDEIGADVFTADAASASQRAKQLVDGVPLDVVSKESREVAMAAMQDKTSVNTTNRVDEEEGKDDTPARHTWRTWSYLEREAGRVGHYERNPLSAKDNFRETIKHGKGKPDRFVDQYEYFNLVFTPIYLRNMGREVPSDDYIDGWGVHHIVPPGAAGSHPVNTPEENVIKVDRIEKWQEVLKAPTVKFDDDRWAKNREAFASIKAADDRFAGIFMAPGLFERTHFLMGMSESLAAFYEHPEEMHDIIDVITEWEIAAVDEACAQLEPELLFHHDDWGTALNSFLDPQTHRDFFYEPYKRIYNRFRENGGEVVIHHSDSYAANLVPIWCDLKIDCWQGCIEANDVPALIDRYGDRLTFMGGIDEAVIDDPASTEESCKRYARERIEACGATSYIPCQTRGLGMTIIPERYRQVSEVIAEMSKEFF